MRFRLLSVSAAHEIAGFLLLCCSISSVGMADDLSITASTTHVSEHRSSALELRAAAFAKALDLDASQQTRLLQVLELQRQQTLQVWSDTSVPAVYRVTATRVISERAADQIRALLNEEQLKKYKPAVQRHEAAGRSAEEWMDDSRKAQTASADNVVMGTP